MNLFLVVFILLVFIVTVFYPVSGHYEVKAFRKKMAMGVPNARVRFFRSNILWSWVPVLIIAVLMILKDIPPDQLGLKWIDLNALYPNPWITIPVVALYCMHLIYNTYLIARLKTNKKSREKIAGTIAEDIKWFLPVSREEKRTWTLVSISAGITEEFVYRGYFFYALAVIFPNLTLVHILLITTLMFGIGHVYLGKEVFKSSFLGLLFGVYYIIFYSLIPVILIHTVQDLVIRDILDEKSAPIPLSSH